VAIIFYNGDFQVHMMGMIGEFLMNETLKNWMGIMSRKCFTAVIFHPCHNIIVTFDWHKPGRTRPGRTICCWQTSNSSDRLSILQWRDWLFRLEMSWFVNITLWLFTDLDCHITAIWSHEDFVWFFSIAVIVRSAIQTRLDCTESNWSPIKEKYIRINSALPKYRNQDRRSSMLGSIALRAERSIRICEGEMWISLVEIEGESPGSRQNNFVRPVSSFSMESERRFRCRHHPQEMNVGEVSRGSSVRERMQMKHFAFPFIESPISRNFVNCSCVKPFQKSPRSHCLHPAESEERDNQREGSKANFFKYIAIIFWSYHCFLNGMIGCVKSRNTGSDDIWLSRGRLDQHSVRSLMSWLSEYNDIGKIWASKVAIMRIDRESDSSLAFEDDRVMPDNIWTRRNGMCTNRSEISRDCAVCKNDDPGNQRQDYCMGVIVRQNCYFKLLITIDWWVVASLFGF
jgi:hypothetical protein